MKDASEHEELFIIIFLETHLFLLAFEGSGDSFKVV